MQFKSLAILTSLAAIFAFNQPLSASIWINRSIEEIAGDADVIVIARPLFDQVQTANSKIRGSSYDKPGNPESFPFVVSKVLFGQFVKPEQLILVENDGNNHLLRLFFGKQFQVKRSTETSEKSKKPVVKETLLFLHKSHYRRESQADYRLVYDGIRVLTQEGQTLVPEQWGTFDEPGQTQDALWREGDFQDSVRRLSQASATIQFKRRIRRMCDHGPAVFSTMSADLQTWKSPEQSVFGIPIISQSIGEPSDPQENLPPVQPQADQP